MEWESIFALTDDAVNALCRALRASYTTDMQCLTRPSHEARTALWALQRRYLGIDDG